MRKWIFAGLPLVLAGICFVGCQGQQSTTSSAEDGVKSAAFKGPMLLAVDFKPDVPLKYKFVCERQSALDLDPSDRSGKGRESAKSGRVQNTTERLEMEIVYKPIEVDPYGYSVIEATCNSAKVTRESLSGRNWSRPDAAESLVGKSFTLKITPTGKVADYSSLEMLIKEVGKNAFGGDTKRGSIKEPDMIMDFVATQWSIWDSVSSIKNPLKGLKRNSNWDSKLLAPMPFVSKIGRDVRYKFTGVVESNDVYFAEIMSSYNLSKSPPEGIPMPYTGSFQMKGVFGFLQGYNVLSLEGTGRQLYDIKKGLIKSDIQQYKAEVTASIFGLGGIEPSIKINQTITMTLVE